MGFNLQCDLKDISRNSEYNDSYRYILFVIDIFSKMLYFQPQFTKTAEETTKSLEKIILGLEEKPKFLCSDRGKEFFSTKTKNMLKKHDIHLYATFNYDVKASIVERLGSL